MFGAKNPKAHNNVADVNGRCDVIASDFYVSQLRNFLEKNSNASFDCRKHQHQTNLTNSFEPKNQHKDFKRKCKRAVYNFMKGLLDERKFKKIYKFNQEEPIYFEVSFIHRIFFHQLVFMYVASTRHIDSCFTVCLEEEGEEEEDEEKHIASECLKERKRTSS